MDGQHLSQMINGWFVGDFIPSVARTPEFEVGVKRYQAGDQEAEHFHKIATEITVVVSGRIRMAGRDWEEGSIIHLPPGTPSSFEALTEATLTVVKFPSIAGDKYLVSGD